MIRKQCLQWVTVPHGQTGDRQIRPGYPRYSRCLPWLAGWDMKCVLSPDRHMPRDSNLEVDHLVIRTGGFARSHRLAVITTGSSVSVVDSLDICNHVAHNRTLPYRLNQLVGFSSQTAANREMAIIKRETLLRPGPHPHRSARTCITRPPFHLHALNLHWTRHHRTLRSSLSINKPLCVRKQMPRRRIKIVRRHRRCPHKISQMG